MLCMRSLGLWTAVLTLLCALPVAAQESPLAQVPADAPIVIHLRGFERTKGRFLAMVKNALPDSAYSQIEGKLEFGLKDALEDRELKGLVADGPIFLVFTDMPVPQQKPNIAVIARVTKYSEFRDGLLKEDERKALKADPAGYEGTKFKLEGLTDDEIYFVDRKDYAVITPQVEVAAKFAKKEKKTGLDSKLSKEAAQKLLESDLGVYVNMAAVNEQFAAQIKDFKEQFDKGLGEFGAAAPGNLHWLKFLKDPLFQALADSRSILVCLDFRPEGLGFHVQDHVAADSQTNTFLKQLKPSPLTDLGKLPQDLMVYLGIQTDPALVKPLQTWLLGNLTDPDSEQNKDIKEALDQLANAKLGVRLDGYSMPMKGVQAWQFEQPDKAAEAQLKLYKALEGGELFQSAVVKDRPDLKENAQTHRNFKLHSVRVVWDFDKTIDKQAPAQIPDAFKRGMAESMKKMLGEELNIWFGSDGKTFVQVTAKDWESARRYLDSYLDGKGTVGQRQAFQDTRKHLPAQATLLTLIDVPDYVQMMAEYIQNFGQGIGQQLPALGGSKGKPSYLGMAFTLQPGRGSVDLWIPGSAASEVYTSIVEPLMKAFGGP